jgi:transcriptional regulator with PAS, ATPase and Fis domain
MAENESTLSANYGFARSRRWLPAEPHLFRVIHCERPLAVPSRHRLGNVDEVSIGRGADEWRRTEEAGRRKLSLRTFDPRMSSLHAQLHVAPSGVTISDANSKNGVLVNGRRVSSTVLGDEDVILLGGTFFVFRLIEPSDGEDDFVPASSSRDGVATLLPPLARELATLTRIARSPMPVLVLGETGTGKEVVAQMVHELSGRRGPFVPVNCGALPDTLIESELFGFRKGSFSGAIEDRLGAIRTSDGGTLLLDEVGDLRLAAQPTLLRVLQQRQVSPLGHHQPVDVDLRVVAATHHDLDALVAQGRFRNDLLARLSGFTIALPPLRQRREDLGHIVATLLGHAAADPAAITFTPDAVAQMLRYEWPLNIRELGQCLSAAAVVANGPIDVEHLRLRDDGKPTNAAGDHPSAGTQLRAQLLALMTQHNGNVSAVARAMNKDRTQIRRWLKAFGLAG